MVGSSISCEVDIMQRCSSTLLYGWLQSSAMKVKLQYIDLFNSLLANVSDEDILM
jgi:hypothetical protein